MSRYSESDVRQANALVDRWVESSQSAPEPTLHINIELPPSPPPAKSASGSSTDLLIGLALGAWLL